MLIENDFEHDDGHRQPDAPASTPPPPLVVIQYRNRGIPLVLVPPVLILAAVLGFQVHRRFSPPRVVITSPPVLAADGGRPLEKASTSADEATERFLARGASFLTPSPDLWEPLPPVAPFEPMMPPDPGPSPEQAVSAEDRTPPPPAPEPVEAAAVEAPAQADPPAPDPGPVQGAAPLPPPAPEPTKEEVLDRIRLEAEQKAARLRSLEAWRPRLLEKDQKLGEEIRALQIVEIQRQAEAKRVAFHAELRKLVVALGDRAGPQINTLCEKYGRVTMPEIYNAVQVRLRRTSTRLGRREKVEMMRRLGLPEPIILDALTRDAARTLNTRGGPRDMDEVRALAGRLLLAIPPGRGASAAAKPVAEASMAPVPGAGRRPQ